MRPGTFDPRELEISVAERGFVIGVSKIGEAIGTGTGERADITREVNSIKINRVRGVADDLFVKSSPASCTIGLIFTDSVPKLKSRDLVVSYRGQQLYRGNVTVSSRSATVDTTVRGGKRWTVTMQSADLNFGSRKLALAAYESETSMTDGILERVPGVTSVEVSDSVVHRARTFRMPSGTAWGTGSTDLGAFFESIGRTLSCIVEVSPESPRVVRLVGYDDGVTWQVGDQAHDDPSYLSVQIDDDRSYPTGIRLTALGSSVGEGDDPELYSAAYYEGGAARNDKDLSVAVPASADAVRAVLNSLPTFSSLPESVRGVTIPFSEALDLSDTPVRLRLWLEGQLWEASIVGVSHTLTPHPEKYHSKWSVAVTLGALYLVTRDGTNVDPVTGIDSAAGAVTWADAESASVFRVDYRTDGRWAQYPGEGTGGADVAPAVQAYTLPGPGAYCVSVWAKVSDERYSEARTIEVTV